jgi:hypothetical protein
VRAAALIAALVALVGCGPPNPQEDPATRTHTRQEPSNLTPGISISGYANIGVKKRF